jgi:hypothetical protein
MLLIREIFYPRSTLDQGQWTRNGQGTRTRH